MPGLLIMASAKIGAGDIWAASLFKVRRGNCPLGGRACRAMGHERHMLLHWSLLLSYPRLRAINLIAHHGAFQCPGKANCGLLSVCGQPAGRDACHFFLSSRCFALQTSRHHQWTGIIPFWQHVVITIGQLEKISSKPSALIIWIKGISALWVDELEQAHWAGPAGMLHALHTTCSCKRKQSYAYTSTLCSPFA